MLIGNTLKAAKELKTNKIALAGGVSANSYIRKAFLELEKQGYKIYYPDPILCTDQCCNDCFSRILQIYVGRNFRSGPKRKYQI